MYRTVCILASLYCIASISLRVSLPRFTAVPKVAAFSECQQCPWLTGTRQLLHARERAYTVFDGQFSLSLWISDASGAHCQRSQEKNSIYCLATAPSNGYRINENDRKISTIAHANAVSLLYTQPWNLRESNCLVAQEQIPPQSTLNLYTVQ